MPLGGYANKPLGMIYELSDGWDEQDWAELERGLSRMSYDDWEAWRKAQATEISAFVAATPKRRSAKRWAENRHLLSFAAAQHCAEAAELLRLVSVHCQEGISYRDMAASAGYVHRQIQDSMIAYLAQDSLGDDHTNLLAIGVRFLFQKDEEAKPQS